MTNALRSPVPGAGAVADYTAEIYWERGDQNFVDKRYSRKHTWRFDGGLELTGSSAPSSVPVPLSDPAALDPEEAFVASLSSCHLLWFLAIAAQRKFCVDQYRDTPIGTLAQNKHGKVAISVVILRPYVTFSGPTRPTRDEIGAMHATAHEECYIANSVTTEVLCKPAFEPPTE